MGASGRNDTDAEDTLDLSDRLSRTTTANDVTRVLRRRILEGRYPVDKFIRQETIALELGVSRIPFARHWHSSRPKAWWFARNIAEP